MLFSRVIIGALGFLSAAVSAAPVPVRESE
jgi:hypothetical protein